MPQTPRTLFWRWLHPTSPPGRWNWSNCGALTASFFQYILTVQISTMYSTVDLKTCCLTLSTKKRVVFWLFSEHVPSVRTECCGRHADLYNLSGGSSWPGPIDKLVFSFPLAVSHSDSSFSVRSHIHHNAINIFTNIHIYIYIYQFRNWTWKMAKFQTFYKGFLATPLDRWTPMIHLGPRLSPTQKVAFVQGAMPTMWILPCDCLGSATSQCKNVTLLDAKGKTNDRNIDV